MFETLIQKESLYAAFKRVKANRGCPGMDGKTIQAYERNLAGHLGELERLLKHTQYRPLPVKQVHIPKPNGKTRPLGIPAVRDRIVQTALLAQIEPYLEPAFAPASFGFRPGKSAIQAVEKVEEYLKAGYAYVVDADIKDFFGTLNHHMLMTKLRQLVPDANLCNLALDFLNAEIMQEGELRTATAGTPQGGIISPILANLYLNGFDHSIEKTDWKLVRYADDFVILCISVNAAVQAMHVVRQILGALKLELAEEKTRVTEWRKGFDSLGYRFQKYRKATKWPRKKAVAAFQEKVRHLTRRLQPKNVLMVIRKLNPVIRGWGNYFRYGNSKTRFEALDGWIRMRLRSFIEKKKWPSGMNWKYPNDHFVSLGLVSLASLLAVPTYQQLSFAAMAQPYRRAVCGKSARTVR